MSTDSVTISVIVPLFNGERFIGETLDSLARQTPSVHEVVVVDDGSGDAGPAAAKDHAVGARLVRQEHGGVAVARNRGALAATGTHVAFLDQDDIWLRGRHARMLRWYSENDPSDVAITNCTSFVSEGNLPALQRKNEGLHPGAIVVPDGSSVFEELSEDDEGDTPRTVRRIEMAELLGGPPSVTSSFIANRELWLSSGGCFPLVRSADDYVGLLAASMGASIFLIDEPSLAYRVHPGSTSMTTTWNLPLLTAAAAVRHGDRIVGIAAARDPHQVPPLRDGRYFLLHQLGGLADTGQWHSLLDAAACLQLLGTSSAEKARISSWIARRWLRQVARGFSRRIADQRSTRAVLKW